MDNFSVQETYDALYDKMLQYIKTVYLGKNHDLRDACVPDLEKPLSISQSPYIEANESYKSINNGLLTIDDSLLGKKQKEFITKMIDSNLGFFWST